MIPRLAALSIAEISRRICPVLAGCAECAPLCIVRKPVTTLRLRRVRFTLWRARLAADLVLAIGESKGFVESDARDTATIVNRKQIPSGARAREDTYSNAPLHRAYCERLHALAQCKLCFLSLGSECSSHSHLLETRSAGSLCRSCLRLILRLWLVRR